MGRRAWVASFVGRAVNLFATCFFFLLIVVPTRAQTCERLFEYDKAPASNKITADILIEFYAGTRDDLTVEFLSALADAIPVAFDKVAGTVCDPCRRHIDSVTLLAQSDPDYAPAFESSAYVIAQVEVSYASAGVGLCDTVFESLDDTITRENVEAFVDDCGRFVTTVPDLPTGEGCCSDCNTDVQGLPVSSWDFGQQLYADLELDQTLFAAFAPSIRELQRVPQFCSSFSQETSTTLYVGSDSAIAQADYEDLMGMIIVQYNTYTIGLCYPQRFLSILVGADFGIGAGPAPSPGPRGRHLFLDQHRDDRELQTDDVPCANQFTCLQIEVFKRCSSFDCPIEDDPPFCQLFRDCGTTRRRDLEAEPAGPAYYSSSKVDPLSPLAGPLAHNDEYFEEQCLCMETYTDVPFANELPVLSDFTDSVNTNIARIGLPAVTFYEPLAECEPIGEFACPATPAWDMDMIFNVTIDSVASPILADDFADVLLQVVPPVYDLVAGTVCDPCARRLEVIRVVYDSDTQGFADTFAVAVAVEQSGGCSNIFDTSVNVTSVDEIIEYTGTCTEFHSNDVCCCGCLGDDLRVSKEDFRELLEFVSVPILDVSDAIDFDASTPVPTQVPTIPPTVCINPDLECSPNPSGTFNATILVGIRGFVDPFQFVSTFRDVYNSVAGTVCDRCSRRIVGTSDIFPIFPEDFLDANGQVRYYNGYGSRNLQTSANAPDKIVLNVTIEQSGSCNRAFDGNTNEIDYQDVVLLFEATCGTHYEPLDETCCCLCEREFSPLNLTRADFLEALQARLSVDVVTVSELSLDQFVCAQEVRPETYDFVFELEDELTAAEEEVFLESFIDAYNQASLDNCIHQELQTLQFVPDTRRRANRELRGRQCQVSGSGTSNCAGNVCPPGGGFNFLRRLAEKHAMDSVLQFRLHGNKAKAIFFDDDLFAKEDSTMPFERRLQQASFVEQCLCRSDFDAPNKTYALPTAEQTTELLNENLQGTGIPNVTVPTPTPPPTPPPMTKGKGKGKGWGKGMGTPRGMPVPWRGGPKGGMMMMMSWMSSRSSSMMKSGSRRSKKMYYRYSPAGFRNRPRNGGLQRPGGRPPSPRYSYNNNGGDKKNVFRQRPARGRPANYWKMM